MNAATSALGRPIRISPVWRFHTTLDFHKPPAGSDALLASLATPADVSVSRVTAGLLLMYLPDRSGVRNPGFPALNLFVLHFQLITWPGSSFQHACFSATPLHTASSLRSLIPTPCLPPPLPPQTDMDTHTHTLPRRYLVQTVVL